MKFPSDPWLTDNLLLLVNSYPWPCCPILASDRVFTVAMKGPEVFAIITNRSAQKFLTVVSPTLSAVNQFAHFGPHHRGDTVLWESAGMCSTVCLFSSWVASGMSFCAWMFVFTPRLPHCPLWSPPHVPVSKTLQTLRIALVQVIGHNYFWDRDRHCCE